MTAAAGGRQSLRRKLVLRIGMPLLLTFIAMIALQYHFDRETFAESVRQKLRAEVQVSCLKIDSDFLAVERAVAVQNEILHAARGKLQPLDSGESRGIMGGILASVVRSSSFVFGAAVAFDPGSPGIPPVGLAPYACRLPEGDEIRSQDLALANDYRYWQQPWFTGAGTSAHGVWSEPYFDLGGGNAMMCTYSLRFAASQGIPAGVATADVALRDVAARIQAGDADNAFDFVLVSHDGRIISAPDDKLLMKSAADFAIGSSERQLIEGAVAFQAGGPDFLRIGHGSALSMGGFRIVFVDVPSTDWTFVGSFPEQMLWSAILRGLLIGPGLLVVGAAVALAVVWRSARSAVAPLEGVMVAIGKLAKGDLSARAPTARGDDEIATVAKAFNGMGEALQGAIAQREVSEAKRAAAQAQLDAARGIQMLLLPESDSLPGPEAAGAVTDQRRTLAFDGADIVGLCIPAGEIAGDYFDWFSRPDGSLVLLIADVCGKGMAAAMMMAVGRTLLRRAASELGEPHLALAKVNEDLLMQAPHSTFTTAILMYIDSRTGQLRYANAGHPAGVLVDRTGRAASSIAATGAVLGMIPQAQWTTASLQLQLGDSLVLFSDGVTEAGPEGADPQEMFGPQRACEAVATAAMAPGADARTIVQALRGAVAKWSDERQADDLTIVAMRRVPGSR